MNAPVSFGPRSFSGHALEGDEVVRLVYLDEAGISRDEQFLTVGAVIVHADNQLIAVERHLDRLVQRWIPAEHQDGFVFHAKDLFNGGGVFDRRDPNWTLPRRLDLAGALAALPKTHGLTLALGALDKLANPERFKEVRERVGQRDWAAFEHATAFSGCILSVDDWMKANHPSEVCMLIVEDNDQARSMIRDTIRHQQSAKAAELFAGEYKNLFPLKRVKEDPLFQPKRSSSVLQLADFWAYVSKKKLMGNAHYNRFWDLLRPTVAPSVFDRAQRVIKPARRKAV